MHSGIPTRIREFWLRYETKIVLFFGFILMAVISFEAGLMKGRETQKKPLIIEQSSQSSCQETMPSQEAANVSNLVQETVSSPAGINTPPGDCVFVGSKNSNKYHLLTCRWAKNIKPENRVCFSSEDEAKSRGYLPDKNCIK